MISSNSALVIHDLQYNDSSYQFSSNIKVDSVLSGDFTLKPVVSITANGMKIFSICLGIEISGGVAAHSATNVTSAVPLFLYKSFSIRVHFT